MSQPAGYPAGTQALTFEGLTTLGFTRLVQGVPEFGLLGC